MLNVFDVASYIVEELGTVTTMKLQKLVYYCQAWSLAWDEDVLFPEKFQAWANGPVCKELFDLHKGLFTINSSAMFNQKLSGNDFTQDQKDTIDSVIEYYGDKSPTWLSDLTHSELPWIEARGDCQEGAYCSNCISEDTMQQYYAGL